jgi:capsular exopolysaccharide synthesis family protein
VVEDLDLDASAAEVRRSISATAPNDTVLIDVTVTDASPDRAQKVAASLGVVFPQLVAELEGGTGETAGGDRAEPAIGVAVTERPDRPTSPVAPDPARNIALGVAAGLLVGFGVMFTRAALDRTLTTGEDVREVLGAPVLARVPVDAPAATRPLERGATDQSAEAFRRLRNNLHWLDDDETCRTLVLTSALPGEGVPVVSANLALALADAGHRVVLVCADLRDGEVSELLGMAGDPGLTDVLTGRKQVGAVLQEYGGRGLWVVPSGPGSPDPGDLIASRRTRDLVDKLRGDFDFVLVAVSPLLSVADASAVARHTDGVLLVVAHGRARPEQERQAGEVLDLARARLLGVVMTGSPGGRAESRQGAEPRREVKPLRGRGIFGTAGPREGWYRLGR